MKRFDQTRLLVVLFASSALIGADTALAADKDCRDKKSSDCGTSHGGGHGFWGFFVGGGSKESSKGAVGMRSSAARGGFGGTAASHGSGQGSGHGGAGG